MSIRKRAPRLASTPAARLGAKRIGGAPSATDAQKTKTAKPSPTSLKQTAADRDGFERDAFSANKILGSTTRSPQQGGLRRERSQGTRAAQTGLSSLRLPKTPGRAKKFLRASMNALLAVSILSGALSGSFAQAAPLVDVGAQQTQQVQMMEQAPQEMAGTLSLMNLRMAGDVDLQDLHDVNPPLASENSSGATASSNVNSSVSSDSVSDAASDTAMGVDKTSGAGSTTSADPEPLPDLDLDLEKVSDALMPSAMSAADPLVLLDGIEDGKVRVDIPLKAGSYDAAGGIKVAPGTVLHIDVEIQDGKLVPSSSDGGTRASFSNPLDAKAWVEADGLYLDATGNGEGRLMVDLSGFFDQGVTESVSLELGDFVRALMGPNGGNASSSSSGSSANAGADNGLMSAFQFDQVSFSTTDIEFAAGELDFGSAKISVDEGTSFKLLGDASQAVLTGQIQLDGGLLAQDGTQVNLDNAAGTLSLTMEESSSGNRVFDASITGLDAQLSELSMSGSDVDGKSQQVHFSKVSLQNGSLSMQGEAKADGSALTPSQLSFSGHVSGALESADLNLSDGAGGASLQLSTPHFAGQVDLDENGLSLNGSVERGQIQLQGLDLGDSDSKLSVQNATVQGDATLQLDKDGSLNLELNATKVDITLSDLVSYGSSTDLDLGKTQVRGSGVLNIQSGTGTAADGLHLSGDLQVDGVIDDLQVRDSSDPDASVILDVRADSRLGGQLRQLNLPSDGPLTLDAVVSVDAGLERFSVDNGSFNALGSGSLQGAAHLLLQGGNLQIDQSSLTANLNVQDAHIAPAGGAFELDVASGATLGVELQQLGMQANATTKIQLGAGSFLSGSLDSGQLEMNGQQIHFDSDTRVDFSVQSVVTDDDGTSLRGQLKLNVGADTDLPAAFTQGLPTDAQVQGQLIIDNVQLNADGSFALNDVKLTLDGQLGSVDSAQSAQNDTQSTAPTSLRGLLDAHPEVNTNQDLINLLHVQNGGTFDGAARGAMDVGLSINDLVAERGAMVSDLLPNDVVIAPLDLVSVADVQASSAADLIDLKMPAAAALNPATLADLIDSGTLKMKIPISGDVGNGSWLGSATFPAGTVLEIEAGIVDGKIDPGQLQANFSNPGDGPAWVTVNGVYLDDDQTLRLDLGGMVDFALPGMENLPMDVSDLLQRLTPDTPTATSNVTASSSSSGMQGVHLGDLSFQIDDIKLQGDLPTANANLTFGENTTLSLHGDLNQGRLFGQVDLDNASIDGGDIALQGATGDAGFELSYQRTDSGLQSVLTIEGAQLQVDALGQRGDNGDFVHLENASTSGRIVIETQFSTDALGIPTTVQNVNADAVLHQMEGDLVGARVSVPLQDGSMQQVELGPSTFSGNLSVNDNALSSLNGTVNDLVAQLNGGDLQVAGQAVSVDNARLVGTGDIHFNGSTVSVSDADVALLANLSDASVSGTSDVGPVRVVGGQAQLHVRVADLQNLTFDAGQLSLDADQVQAGIQVSAQQILGTSWSSPTTN